MLLLAAALFILAAMLRGQVSANQATAYCTDDRMMARIVTSDATDDRALKTSCGVRWRDDMRIRQEHGNCKGCQHFHRKAS